MHHTSVVGPVLDEDGKALPFKSFHVKGLLESNNPTELLTDAEFKALDIGDAGFTRTAGGGFEYSFEIVVNQSKLARVLADEAAAAKAKIKADTEAAAKQQEDQHEAAKKAAYEQGKKDAELEMARKQGAASVANVPPTKVQ